MANSKRLPAVDARAQVISVLDRRVKPHSRLCVGLSGGLDSVVLFDVLRHLRDERCFDLCAVHVNHQLSPRAAAWAELCSALCRNAGVPLHVEAIALERDRGTGVEAAARRARYAVYTRQAVDFIVLAHHLDDQVETILLQLLRGAGVKGLKGMTEVSFHKGEAIVPARYRGSLEGAEQITRPAFLRPLLEVPRSTLEAYARAHSLPWVEDESNFNLRFDRNFVRHRVLPPIGERFPAYRTTLARAARNLAEALELLDDLAAHDAGTTADAARLSISVLGALSVPRAKNLLRYFIARSGAPLPNAKRLEEMVRQLADAHADGDVQFRWADVVLRRFRGQAYLETWTALPEDALCVPWHGEAELALPGFGGVLCFEHAAGVGLSLAKLEHSAVCVRARRGGERIRLAANRPRRSLKNLFQERRVPVWKRQRIPLLFCGGRLVWVPEIGIDWEFHAGAGEPGVQVSWLPQRSAGRSA
jgi:tRNA(Ile)-lysidine synthase